MILQPTVDVAVVYAGAGTIRASAVALGVSYPVARRWLAAAGVAFPERGGVRLAGAVVDEIVSLYCQGVAYKEIAYRTGAPIGTVSRTIHKFRLRGLVGRRNRVLAGV